MDVIEKIDQIRSRMEVGYREAREALEAAGGDVVQALIDLEEKKNNISGKIHHHSHEFMGQLKGILHKGHGTKIRVKQGDRTVFEFPASVGALGLLGVLASSELAVLGALGTIAAMTKNYSLEFDKAEGAGNGEAKPDPTPGEI